VIDGESMTAQSDEINSLIVEIPGPIRQVVREVRSSPIGVDPHPTELPLKVIVDWPPVRFMGCLERGDDPDNPRLGDGGALERPCHELIRELEPITFLADRIMTVAHDESGTAKTIPNQSPEGMVTKDATHVRRLNRHKPSLSISIALPINSLYEHSVEKIVCGVSEVSKVSREDGFGIESTWNGGVNPGRIHGVSPFLVVYKPVAKCVPNPTCDRFSFLLWPRTIQTMWVPTWTLLPRWNRTFVRSEPRVQRGSRCHGPGICG
jgi:hypothetical protein